MVIRMRHNRSQTKSRRSHHALKAPVMAVCSQCGAHHRPHHMCLECGFYNGRQVMDLKAKKEAREARIKAKKEAIRAQFNDAAPTEAEAVSNKALEEAKTDKKAEDTK